MGVNAPGQGQLHQPRTAAQGGRSAHHRGPGHALAAADAQQLAVVPLVALGVPGAEALLHPLPLDGLQSRRCFCHNLRGNPRLHGNHLAAVLPAGIEDMPGLGNRKGGGIGGLDAGAVNRTGIALHAAGNIQRQHRHTALVDKLRQNPHRLRHHPPEAKAIQAVYDVVRPGDYLPGRPGFPVPVGDGHAAAHVAIGVPGQVCGREALCQHHRHLGPCVPEEPRRHIADAALDCLAAEDGHCLPPDFPFLLQEPDCRRPCRFHQLLHGAALFHCAAFHGLHLFFAVILHSASSFPSTRAAPGKNSLFFPL